MRRDIFLDEIQQVGKVLGKILGDFLGFKSKGYISQGIKNSKQQLKSELDIDLFHFFEFSENELNAFVLEKKMTEEHLEIISELFYEIGESKLKTDKIKAIQYLIKATEMLKSANDISSTLSYMRQQKIKAIQRQIRQSE